MQHHFDIEIAEAYGLNEAIILNNIRFWVLHNEANGTNFHDGRFWTYNSMKAFEELFPYMKPRGIRAALENLERNGLILTGNYNQSTYDRTKWYALSDKGYALFAQLTAICQKRQMDLSEMTNGFVKNDKSNCQKPQMALSETANGFVRNDEPIPDIKPDMKPVKKTSDRKPEPKRTYGRYGNVKLTDTDLSKLKDEFPDDWQERIDRLSTYMDSTGKSYKNHLATIRNWARRDSERQKPSRNSDSRASEQDGQGKRIADMTIEEIMEKYNVDYMTAQEMAFDMC